MSRTGSPEGLAVPDDYWEDDHPCALVGERLADCGACARDERIFGE